MKFKEIDFGIIIAVISVSILLLFTIQAAFGLSKYEGYVVLAESKYEGYMVLAEKEENRYNILVIKDINKEEIKTYTNIELDGLAQQNGKDYGNKGQYFSINEKDFNRLEKGQKVEIYYKKQAGPDIWGYPIKAARIKIIEN